MLERGRAHEQNEINGIDYGVIVDRGNLRERNEDWAAVFVGPINEYLAVVADGMGGEAMGAVAAHRAVSSLEKSFDGGAGSKNWEEWTRESILRANSEVLRLTQAMGGTTVVAATVVGGQVLDRACGR